MEKTTEASDDEELMFVQTPSKILFCSICQELYKNPVITRECNHTFCEGI